jgi:hypothetical protein
MANIIPLAIGGTALGVGGFVGAKAYQNNSDMGEDRVSRSASRGVSTALAAGTGLGLGAAAIKTGSFLHKNGVINSVPLTTKISNAVSNTKSIEFNKSLLTKTPIMAGAGALIGGVIGSQVDKDNPAVGTAVGAGAGAGVGVLSKSALAGTKLWEKLGPIGRGASIIGASLGVAAVATSMKDKNYKSMDTAESDGMGSYNLAPSGVKNRLNTMNANGNIVFGLNNKR